MTLFTRNRFLKCMMLLLLATSWNWLGTIFWGKCFLLINVSQEPLMFWHVYFSAYYSHRKCLYTYLGDNLGGQQMKITWDTDYKYIVSHSMPFYDIFGNFLLRMIFDTFHKEKVSHCYAHFGDTLVSKVLDQLIFACTWNE